jgi:wyosine [tRNA(Phe)-imidazoG37] synthetase (radical SAM superfamily)
MKKHVFGPVPSRRLGFSLGVDPIPRKSCNYDCVYCQIGKTAQREVERQSFFDPDEVVSEVLDAVRGPTRIDVITFSGSGEPTLNKDLGCMIRQVKSKTDKAVAVITNGSLLSRPDVREDVALADILLPSLDAGSQNVFELVNRPHPSITIQDVVAGLESISRGFRGKIWLEIMLIKGMNDSFEEQGLLRAILGQLSVDRVQLNTVTRPPSEQVLPLGAAELAQIGASFGDRSEVICGFDKRADALGTHEWVECVLAILDRRSLTVDDVVRLTGIPLEEAEQRLKRLEREEVILSVRQAGDVYYMTKGPVQP